LLVEHVAYHQHVTSASVHMVITVSVNRLYVCLAYTCVSDSWALPCPLDFVI
jgi:hypothetical protein